jgi:phage terminase small subunit
VEQIAVVACKIARGLTHKQLAFARAYVDCGNASEAYRRSYAADKLARQTIANAAHRLINAAGIKAEVARIRVEADKAASQALGLSREFVINGLMNVATLGSKLNVDGKPSATFNLSAANQALTALGKVDTLGLFVERTESTVQAKMAGMTDEELDAYIASRVR